MLIKLFSIVVETNNDILSISKQIQICNLNKNNVNHPSFSAKEHGTPLLRSGRPLPVQKRGQSLRNAFRPVAFAKSSEIRSSRFPEKGETTCQKNKTGNVELRRAESDLR